MALIKLKGKGFQSIPHDKALAIWHVMSGEQYGSEKQRLFARQVQKIYLNWHTAPASYLKANKSYLPLDAIDHLTPKQPHWQDK